MVEGQPPRAAFSAQVTAVRNDMGVSFSCPRPAPIDDREDDREDDRGDDREDVVGAMAQTARRARSHSFDTR